MKTKSIPDRTSRMPHFSFADTLEAQEARIAFFKGRGYQDWGALCRLGQAVVRDLRQPGRFPAGAGRSGDLEAARRLDDAKHILGMHLTRVRSKVCNYSGAPLWAADRPTITRDDYGLR